MQNSAAQRQYSVQSTVRHVSIPLAVPSGTAADRADKDAITLGTAGYHAINMIDARRMPCHGLCCEIAASGWRLLNEYPVPESGHGR